MKLVNYLNQIKFQFLFILFVTFYALYYSFYGYDDADGGYTLALSWRIFNGEIPYRDFILVRPPISPLLHALPLFIIPDNYQLIFDRFFCYILFASSSLFGALSIDKVFNLKEFKLHPYLLATLGFVFSVGSFPSMAWHTVDAIFFASIGVYILVCRPSLYFIVLGMLFLFLSALCKQPFYLMPFAGVAFIFINYKDWKKSLIAIFSLILFTGIFFFILYRQDAHANYISLTSGSTKIKDLFSAGILCYLNITSLYLLLPFALWLIVKKRLVFMKIPIKENVVPYFFISVLLGLPLLKFIYVLSFKEVTYFTFFRDSTATLLFIVTIFFLIANLSIEKKWITLWILTLISWCASISWGYQTPVLFSMPLLFGFLLASNQFFEVNKIGSLAIYILVFGSTTYFVAYQKPYCNPVRQLLTYKIDDLFPKMQYINVSKEIHDKYSEFSSLVTKYGVNFKTLPGMPLSNYLTNTNSPIKIDWVFNAETNNENHNIITELEFKKTIIFMEKNPQLIVVTDSKEKFNSTVAYYIKNNWLKIDSTYYFEIYKHDEKY